MTLSSPSTSIPPGPGFVIGVAAATGIRRTPAYATAQLLLTHPGPRRDSETVEGVEDGMRRLADALNLGPGDRQPPVIGGRLLVCQGFAALDYGHAEYMMTIPSPSQDWLALVERGAACRVCLVFAPLALTADQAETDAHLRDSFERGSVVWGTTYVRRRL
ncbi:hypothetical protein [Streptomyces sp. SID12501]|uniref:Uncharacterized protein n=1 Tax=Streptomyces sp. SID12501 TaxID=2706042 RepID=A0A6B3C259_9ACTN|nr:hypothetical protein [Streptomyces sp. SID12501]NEC90390.1 hypothetical protein [Streptomyces sp. SID12501]